jgi:hypothetical protein
VRERRAGGGEFIGFHATENAFLLHIVERASELIVAGSFGDHGMEAEILFDVLEAVSFGEITLGAGDAGGEFSQQRRGDDGGRNGVIFQHDAEVVEVANLFRRELTYVGAAPGLDPDQALGLEAVEGFANGRLADSQVVGEVFLGEAKGAVDSTQQNSMLDAAVGELSKIWCSDKFVHHFGLRDGRYHYKSQWAVLLLVN